MTNFLDFSGEGPVTHLATTKTNKESGPIPFSGRSTKNIRVLCIFGRGGPIGRKRGRLVSLSD